MKSTLWHDGITEELAHEIAQRWNEKYRDHSFTAEPSVFHAGKWQVIARKKP